MEVWPLGVFQTNFKLVICSGFSGLFWKLKKSIKKIIFSFRASFEQNFCLKIKFKFFRVILRAIYPSDSLWKHKFSKLANSQYFLGFKQPVEVKINFFGQFLALFGAIFPSASLLKLNFGKLEIFKLLVVRESKILAKLTIFWGKISFWKPVETKNRKISQF